MKIVAIAMMVLVPAVAAAAGRQEVPPNPDRLASMDFRDIRGEARGTTVRMHMWGGSEAVNRWFDQWVVPEVAQRYQITLERVPMDAPVFLNRLRAEQQARRAPGSMDLLWINGENFRNARLEGLLWGPFASLLPNFSRYVDPRRAEQDSGFPVEGFAVPWGQAQFNFDVDFARVPDFPETTAELSRWVRENPGIFTYPEPRDFTGSAFIRQTFIALTGGAEQYMAGYDEELLNRNAPILWEFLRDIAPYLWYQGRSYPRDLAALDSLFQRGEVAVTMSFTQTNAATRIAQGRYPHTVQSRIFRDGSIANTHGLAIPFNAPNPGGALVVADFLLSPEAQLEKNRRENWGDFTVLAPGSLTAEFREAFATVDLGEATVPLEELARYAVADIPSEYWEELERRWEHEVLRSPP